MADNDEEFTISDSGDAAWVTEQRKTVEAYLQAEGCNHSGVSLEPRWYLSPYLALSAVRSKANPDRVGWRAVSGDVPTDYMSASRELQSAADVLAAFGAQWAQCAERMARGEDAGVALSPELAPLLRARAKLLQQLSEELRADVDES